MYSFQSRVRFSEVGDNGKMKLNSVINYFQDCSTFHTEDLGMGIPYLEGKNKVWLLSAWQVVINRYADLCENIIIGTWPYDFKGIFGYRNYTMRNSEGELLAYANSVWISMDTQLGKPVRITDDMCKLYTLEKKLDMEYAPRKIDIPRECNSFEPFPVRTYHIDTNNHVNNGQYIQMAKEFIPEGFQIRQMRAEYKKAAVLGDIIIPMVHKDGDKYTVLLSDYEKKPYVAVEFYQ